MYIYIYIRSSNTAVCFLFSRAVLGLYRLPPAGQLQRAHHRQASGSLADGPVQGHAGAHHAQRQQGGRFHQRHGSNGAGLRPGFTLCARGHQDPETAGGVSHDRLGGRMWVRDRVPPAPRVRKHHPQAAGFGVGAHHGVVGHQGRKGRRLCGPEPCPA